MVVGRHQKPGRAGGGVVDRLADLRIHHLHNCADDVPGGSELPELARLLDLLEHMLEQIPFGVRVRLVKLEAIHQRDDLGEHSRLGDVEPRAAHEVRR